MRKILLLLVVIGLTGVQALFAQSNKISGAILDDKNEPMPFVTVQLKGTSNGAITDIDGRFELAAQATDTLRVSFVGYKTLDVAVGSKKEFELVMEVANTELEEIVIVAYGTKKKRDLVGSISSVSSKEIEALPVTSFENALQGKATGVHMSSGARAGNVNAVRIRGTSSISASSQPLYVIDGIPQGDYVMGYTGDNAQMSPLANMNPNDIESIQVLKDASAAALYGSRASNGVILITTKRGKEGKTIIDFSSKTGFQTPSHFIDMLNGEQYTELFNEAYSNATGGAVPQVLGNPSDAINTNWIDETTQSGLLQEYSLSARGGNEKTTFYTGFTYKNDEGYTKGNNFERLSGRLNLDQKVTDKLSIFSNLSFSRVVNDRVSGSNSISSATTLGLLQYPNIPVYGDGSEMYGAEGDFYHGTGVNPYGGFARHNLVHDLEESFHKSITVQPTVNMGANYQLIEGLNFKTEMGLDYISMKDHLFWGLHGIDGAGTHGAGQALNYERTNWITTNTMNYNKQLSEDHKFNVLLGYSFQKTQNSSSNVTGQNFPSNELNTLASAAKITNGASTASEVALESYFSRFNYTFKDRYLFEFSIRRDGSSRFGENNKYANFPAASIGWIMSDEDFMANADWISLLKVRTSYGFTGNSEILSSATSASASVLNFASMGLFGTGYDYADVPGLAPTQLSNPDLKWEQTAQFDFGVNMGVLDGRIQLEADYYYKKTKDLLLSVKLPSTSGYTSYMDNIGKLENKGFEFSITSRNLVNDFKWTTDLNIALNRNKITELEGQIIESGISRAIEGQPIGVFYTVEYAGVDPENGDALYYDLDGNITNVYSNNNRKIMGDPNPDFLGGLTNTFSWKNFDLNVFLQFSYGNEIYRNGGRFVSANVANVWNQSVDQMDRWQNPGDITDVPQARLTNNGSSASSRYIEDGSYIRVKNVMLSYNLPENMIAKSGFSNARLFAQLQNFWTITGYEGNDPEVGSNGVANVGQGVTFLEAPTPKIVMFGVNVSL